ncbi:MAG: AgmX/PglI C-terminal domain-containing protein [Steroidobacteraceae bacterium]
MELAPFYRKFELPWEDDQAGSRRFKRYLLIALGIYVLGALVIPIIKVPQKPANLEEAVPPRLARIMIEEQPKPPPPPPPPPKPVEAPRPVETRPQPRPVDRQQQARREAENAGLMKMQDQLADLRQQMDTPPQQTRNLTGAVGADTKAERSLIASKAGSSSSGITTTSAASRGFGSGAGSLTGHETTSVSSRVAGIGAPGTATRTGNSGKASRSPEEIELEFDRNKGAIYALYARALREKPDLQGKLVLEFTIAPSGEVTACRVVSSELKDPELERRIVARVRLIRFAAKDVEPTTTTKPIEFFPA